MHADAIDAGGFGGGLDDAQQVTRVDRPAELGGEHQAGFGPVAARSRSAFFSVRCLCSIVMTAGESGTVRRARCLGFREDEFVVDAAEALADLQPALVGDSDVVVPPQSA